MIDCAVILAIGSPAHQSQLIYDRPRAMLPALGKPLVVRVMDRLHRAGIRRFIIVLGGDEGAVAGYLNAYWVPDAKIEFVLHMSGSSLSKTLGDIARSNPNPFLIASYNSFTHSHFVERLLKSEQDFPDSLILSGASMTLSKASRHFFALTDGKRVTEVTNDSNRSGLILTDIALCGRNFVEYLASMPESRTGMLSRELMTLIAGYTSQGGATHVADTAWTLQVEADYDLLTLNKALLDEEQDGNILSELHRTVRVIPPVRIDPGVSVGQGAVIGPHVYLESESSIGHQAVVRNAMILKKASVAPREMVADTIISTRARIRA